MEVWNYFHLYGFLTLLLRITLRGGGAFKYIQIGRQKLKMKIFGNSIEY